MSSIEYNSICNANIFLIGIGKYYSSYYQDIILEKIKNDCISSYYQDTILEKIKS